MFNENSRNTFECLANKTSFFIAVDVVPHSGNQGPHFSTMFLKGFNIDLSSIKLSHSTLLVLRRRGYHAFLPCSCLKKPGKDACQSLLLDTSSPPPNLPTQLSFWIGHCKKRINWNPGREHSWLFDVSLFKVDELDEKLPVHTN